jgi:anti-sigma-K factor RskA
MDRLADVHALSGAFAAGAVDDVEQMAFERHLLDCAGCREEVRGLRETLARLADATALEPPPALRRAVLAQIGLTRQVRRPAPSPVPAPVVSVPHRPRARAPWLVAAAFAVLAAGTGSIVWQQYQDTVQGRQVAAVVNAPDARRTVGAATGGGSVSLVRSGSRAAVLTAGLPALPHGRTYQLWIVRQKQVTPAGLGPAGSATGGAWNRVLDGVRPGDVVAISVEPDGGSLRPSTRPVITLTT